MSGLRIAVLCNNRMALPALQQMLQQGVLAGVGVPAANGDLLETCRQLCGQAGVPVAALEKRRPGSTPADWLNTLKPVAVFMMTFPWIIGRELLDAFRRKFFNFHYGLLPRMRGADPVFEVLRQQGTETGITVHEVTQELDQGPVILQHSIPLDDKMTHGMLCSGLGMLGAQICGQLVAAMQKNVLLNGRAQEETVAAYYPRPVLRDVAINWEQMTDREIHALARACNPWNKGVYTALQGWNIRICSFSFSDRQDHSDTYPGTIVAAGISDGVVVKCRDGRCLHIDTFYVDEGFFEGRKLLDFGLRTGHRFTTVPG